MSETLVFLGFFANQAIVIGKNTARQMCDFMLHDQQHCYLLSSELAIGRYCCLSSRLLVFSTTHSEPDAATIRAAKALMQLANAVLRTNRRMPGAQAGESGQRLFQPCSTVVEMQARAAVSGFYGARIDWTRCVHRFCQCAANTHTESK